MLFGLGFGSFEKRFSWTFEASENSDDLEIDWTAEEDS